MTVFDIMSVAVKNDEYIWSLHVFEKVHLKW